MKFFWSLCFIIIIFVYSGCSNDIDERPTLSIKESTTETSQTSIIVQTPTISPIPTIAPTPPTTPVKKDFETLKKKLEDYIYIQEGRYGVYFIDLLSGEQFGIDATDEYIAASTSKLPMNLLLFKKIASGEVDPNMLLEYKENDFESGTGIIQNEDFGKEYTVLETARLSIVYSDNCGINMIIRLLGIDNIRNYMTELGGSIYYGSRHRSSPKDMALYMQELYRFYIETPKVAGILIDNLENTVFNDRINRLLPKDLRVAHKIGTYNRTANDVGIVFTSEPYIISIMSDDVDFERGCVVLGEISKMIYDYIEN